MVDGLSRAPTREEGGDERAQRALIRGWTLLLMAAFVCLSLHPDYGSDAFFHWTLGREVLRTHLRVVPERWSIPGLHATCAVPEWLWDVGAFLVQRAFGDRGIAIMVATFAALAAWMCVRLASRARGGASVILATAAVSPSVLARIQDRPETAVMVLVPGVLLLAERLAAATTRRDRERSAAWIVALVLLWAQVHPSFILAPILVALVAGESLARARALRESLGLLLALVAVAFTSAQGIAVYAYTWKHASSYAVGHVTEWAPPSWGMLDPTTNLHLPLYAALWIAALVGAATARSAPRGYVALALFGFLLIVRGRRNLGLGAELLIPFAASGLDALLPPPASRAGRIATLAGLAASAFVFARLAAILDVEVGPLGTTGAAAALFPSRAAAFLARAPEGTRVMTTYEAGAPLGFWLDGHVRTSLDGRTLLYFDDPEYAAARASWEDAGALDETLRMYSFDAAVVDRANPVCALLAARADWAPVVVEAATTTFVRRAAFSGTGAGHLSPCGEDRFTSDACDDGGARLLAEIDPLAGDAFIDDLRVEARVRCASGPLDADALVAMLPSRSRAAGFLAERDGLLAWILAHAGHVDEAVDLVSPYVTEGDVGAAARIASVLDARGDRRLGPMMRALIAVHDEAAPPWVFALLADACARAGDLGCAATYGVFAGAKGEAAARTALCAVVADHPDPVTRAEAKRWLEALGREAEARGGALPACPP